MTLKGNYPTLSFELSLFDSNRMLIKDIFKGTLVHRMSRWITTLRCTTVFKINETTPTSVASIEHLAKKFTTLRRKYLITDVAPFEKINGDIVTTMPQISLGQMATMNLQYQEANFYLDPRIDP